MDWSWRSLFSTFLSSPSKVLLFFWHGFQYIAFKNERHFPFNHFQKICGLGGVEGGRVFTAEECRQCWEGHTHHCPSCHLFSASEVHTPGWRHFRRWKWRQHPSHSEVCYFAATIQSLFCCLLRSIDRLLVCHVLYKFFFKFSFLCFYDLFACTVLLVLPNSKTAWMVLSMVVTKLTVTVIQGICRSTHLQQLYFKRPFHLPVKSRL